MKIVGAQRKKGKGEREKGRKGTKKYGRLMENSQQRKEGGWRGRGVHLTSNLK